jgi:hypothetical protein
LTRRHVKKPFIAASWLLKDRIARFTPPFVTGRLMNKTMTRIDPPLPLETPKGKAMAHFIIDYGIEHHLMFVCFQDETGECWTWQNPEIRIQKNATVGRVSLSIIGT